MRELANLVGRDTSTYFRYETGQLDLSTEQLRTLAGFYDVSVEHLLGWDRDEVAA